ncbi:MAG: polyphosphate kinase 1 [Dehalococcoidia bacterium]
MTVSQSRLQTQDDVPYPAGSPAGAAPAVDLHQGESVPPVLAVGQSAPRPYLNRELSHVAYVRRCLEEAQDARRPLLERIRFLAICETHLDEFYMTRVSALKEQVAAGVVERTPDGMTPREELVAIRQAVTPLIAEVRRYLLETLTPTLHEQGICLEVYDALTEAQKLQLAQYFEQEVFPVCTPLAIDPGHPFPFISNRSVNLAVRLHDIEGRQRLARLKVPTVLPRLVPVAGEPGHQIFIWLEELLAAHLEKLFPGMVIDDVATFRVLRDADLEIQDLESGDLLETIEELVSQRRFGSAVALQINAGMPPPVLAELVEKLKLAPEDIFEVRGPLGLSDLEELTGLERPTLRDVPFVPHVPVGMGTTEDLFARIARSDVLVHHPFDAFSVVVDFLSRAATDPQVLAIKQTLYRVGARSPIVEALREAVDWGKQVATLVELKARFDEENNIEWARALEEAGVHVTYGLLGLKTHCKVALVVRKDRDGLRRYVHLGTGNYNPSTARTYTDFGLFTCREEIADDVSDLFNYLTGYSRQTRYRKLLVAPVNLREGIMERIEREISCAKRLGGGRLIFKCNSLVDPEIIDALYRASQAGVRVDLVVRGDCCLRPGLPGISERIRVISVVGRFLEHSRLYYFHNDGNEELYMGSADLMPRNLDHRVETLAPVEDPVLRAHLHDDILEGYLRDNTQARELLPDGQYRRITPGENPPFSIWQYLLERSLADSASLVRQDRLAAARGAYRHGRVDPYN